MQKKTLRFATKLEEVLRRLTSATMEVCIFICQILLINYRMRATKAHMYVLILIVKKIVIKLSGLLGVSLPDSVGEGVIVDCAPTDPTIECRVYGDFANATITTSVDNCARVEWSSTYARRLEDCFNVGSGDYIYGGSETLNQYWPVNADKKNENPYITSDFLGGYEFGDLLENYWLFSKGAAVHVDEENPLFVSKFLSSLVITIYYICFMYVELCKLYLFPWHFFVM